MLNKYSNTIIYKIVCLDSTIIDVYVGSTINFYGRKANHKSHCYNEKSRYYNLNFYEKIRDNGGWDNWEMIKIEDYPCENLEQQRKRERYWYNVLLPTMNIKLPLRTEEEDKKIRKDYKKNYSKGHYEKNKEKYKERSREQYKKKV